VSYCILSTVSCLYILRAVCCWCCVSCCRYSDILYSSFNNGSFCYFRYCTDFENTSRFKQLLKSHLFRIAFWHFDSAPWQFVSRALQVRFVFVFDDDNADRHFWGKFYHCLRVAITTNFANNSRSCWRLLTKCFDGWDVSLATNRVIADLDYDHIRRRLKHFLFSLSFSGQ